MQVEWMTHTQAERFSPFKFDSIRFTASYTLCRVKPRSPHAIELQSV